MRKSGDVKRTYRRYVEHGIEDGKGSLENDVQLEPLRKTLRWMNACPLPNRYV